MSARSLKSKRGYWVRNYVLKPRANWQIHEVGIATAPGWRVMLWYRRLPTSPQPQYSFCSSFFAGTFNKVKYLVLERNTTTELEQEPLNLKSNSLILRPTAPLTPFENMSPYIIRGKPHTRVQCCRYQLLGHPFPTCPLHMLIFFSLDNPLWAQNKILPSMG